MATPMRQRMRELVKSTQDQICAALLEHEPESYREDPWDHTGGGGGVSRVWQGGSVLQKAGVNVANVTGELSPAAIEAMIGKSFAPAESQPFAAVGLSVVIHPENPYAPTTHCNYRYFELGDGTWWFGGGADLTPIYFFADDARHFHTTLRTVCDRHDPGYYPRFKAWCDDYFYLPHREEGRGVGGIFFDELRGPDQEAIFAFVADCATSFVDAYVPLLARRRTTEFGERERRWQGVRRARYAEFNLMYDRGTRFGLKTGGRVESILMSMPLVARWEYGQKVEPGSPEAELLATLRSPRDWA